MVYDCVSSGLAELEIQCGVEIEMVKQITVPRLRMRQTHWGTLCLSTVFSVYHSQICV
jgi:hypothetical protein